MIELTRIFHRFLHPSGSLRGLTARLVLLGWLGLILPGILAAQQPGASDIDIPPKQEQPAEPPQGTPPEKPSGEEAARAEAARVEAGRAEAAKAEAARAEAARVAAARAQAASLEAAQAESARAEAAQAEAARVEAARAEAARIKEAQAEAARAEAARIRAEREKELQARNPSLEKFSGTYRIEGWADFQDKGLYHFFYLHPGGYFYLAAEWDGRENSRFAGTWHFTGDRIYLTGRGEVETNQGGWKAPFQRTFVVQIHEAGYRIVPKPEKNRYGLMGWPNAYRFHRRNPEPNLPVGKLPSDKAALLERILALHPKAQ